jgi:5S rRNA maturation endonuclease (ribonuclease M5)
MRPLLYNAHRVQYATTVILCEGEKDSDAVNRLALFDSAGGEVIGTTSGGADSWSDGLANDLKGKRVVLVPDDDPSGEHYAAQIQASLTSRSIDYRLISLSGTGSKDISEFLEAGRTIGDLIDLIGTDWVRAEKPALEPVELEEA